MSGLTRSHRAGLFGGRPKPSEQTVDLRSTKTPKREIQCFSFWEFSGGKCEIETAVRHLVPLQRVCVWPYPQPNDRLHRALFHDPPKLSITTALRFYAAGSRRASRRETQLKQSALRGAAAIVKTPLAFLPDAARS